VGTWVRHRWRRLRGDGDRGFTALEATIAVPLAFVFILLAIQFVLIWHARHVALDAAQDGLHAAAGYRSSAAAGQAVAADQLAKVAPHLLTGTTVTVDRGATTVTVHVRGTVESVTPFLTVHVDEQATGPVERYQPARP
jgi:Flp pilus assembly protein TadG